MVAKPLCPLYKNIIKPLDRARYPELRCKLDVVLQQLQETRQELTDTKRKLKTAETLLADAKEKNRQLEAEREKDAKERKDLENDIALLRSDLYSGTKSQQSGRSAEEVGANDGRDDFDGKSPLARMAVPI